MCLLILINQIFFLAIKKDHFSDTNNIDIALFAFQSRIFLFEDQKIYEFLCSKVFPAKNKSFLNAPNYSIAK